MMDGNYLGRDDAPVSAETWGLLDTVMVEAAKGILSGRRLLDISGPYGLGLKVVPMSVSRGRTGFITSEVLPVPLLQTTFCMGKRDIAAYERDHLALDTSGVATAACACSSSEDALIFQGAPGIPGLLTVKGSGSLKLSPWETVGVAAEEMIQAVTLLDDAGFHGPYSLALAPRRYNLLFRGYPQSVGTELKHIRTIVEGGEQFIKLEVADKIRVEIGRSYIVGRIGSKESKEALPAPEGSEGAGASGGGSFLSKLFGGK